MSDYAYNDFEARMEAEVRAEELEQRNHDLERALNAALAVKKVDTPPYEDPSLDYNLRIEIAQRMAAKGDQDAGRWIPRIKDEWRQTREAEKAQATHKGPIFTDSTEEAQVYAAIRDAQANGDWQTANRLEKQLMVAKSEYIREGLRRGPSESFIAQQQASKAALGEAIVRGLESGNNNLGAIADVMAKGGRPWGIPEELATEGDWQAGAGDAA